MDNIEKSLYNYNTIRDLKQSLMIEKGYSAEEAESMMQKAAWSVELQNKFPQGEWKTISGARVFVNNGKVVAGLNGFNKEIDKFFDSKKKDGGEQKKDTPKKETKQESKEGKVKRKFDYNGSEIIIVKREEDRGDGQTWEAIRVLTPKGDVLPIQINHKETLKSIEDKTRKFLDNVKERGIDVNKQLQTEEKKETKKDKSTPKNETPTLDTFKKIAKESKDVEDFMSKVREIKNVPPEVAKEFQDKYGDGGNKTSRESSLAFLKEHSDLFKKPEKREAPTEADKKYFKENKKEIMDIIDNDPFTSIGDAINEHKAKENKKESEQGKSTRKGAKSLDNQYNKIERDGKLKLDMDSSEDIGKLQKLASKIDEKFMSKEDKNKVNKLIDDLYIYSYSEGLKNDLYDANNLNEALKALKKINNKNSKDGMSTFDDEKIFNKTQDTIIDLLKKQISKKSTEKLNYKLF